VVQIHEVGQDGITIFVKYRKNDTNYIVKANKWDLNPKAQEPPAQEPPAQESPATRNKDNKEDYKSGIRYVNDTEPEKLKGGFYCYVTCDKPNQSLPKSCEKGKRYPFMFYQKENNVWTQWTTKDYKKIKFTNEKWAIQKLNFDGHNVKPPSKQTCIKMKFGTRDDSTKVRYSINLKLAFMDESFTDWKNYKELLNWVDPDSDLLKKDGRKSR